MRNVDTDDLAAMNVQQSVIDKLNEMPNGYQVLKNRLSEDVRVSFSVGDESFQLQSNLYQAMKIYDWVIIFKGAYFKVQDNLGLKEGEHLYEAIDNALTQGDKLALLESQMPVLEAKRLLDGRNRSLGSVGPEYEILNVEPFETMSEFLSFVYGEDRFTLNQTKRGTFTDTRDEDEVESQWNSTKAHWEVFKNISQTYGEVGKDLELRLMVFASTMVQKLKDGSAETVSSEFKGQLYSDFEKRVENITEEDVKTIQNFSENYYGDNYFYKLATNSLLNRRFTEIAKNNSDDTPVMNSPGFKL